MHPHARLPPRSSSLLFLRCSFELPELQLSWLAADTAPAEEERLLRRNSVSIGRDEVWRLGGNSPRACSRGRAQPLLQEALVML